MVLVSGTMVYFATKTKVNYNFEQFFPENAEETDFYYNYIDTFGSDNDFIVMAVVAPGQSVFDSVYLQNIDSIVAQTLKIPQVKDVRSLTNMTYFVRDQFMGNTYEVPYFKRNNLEEDSARIYRSDNVVGSLVNDDATSLAIIIQHREKLDDEGADSLLTTINDIVEVNGDYEAHKVGRVVGHTFYIDIINRELFLFVGLSVILIVIFLVITFRSWYGIYIPLIVVSLSVIWTVGVMGIIGKNLNIVLNIMPTILMVVGISGVVHLLSKYLDEIKEGLDKMEALKKTYKEVGWALVLTSITTIVGFVTLSTSDIRPIIDFGLLTATGVFFTFLFSIFMMRSILTLLPKLKLKRPNSKSWWRNNLGKMYLAVTGKSWIIIGASVIVLGFSIWGTLRIQTNNFIMEDLDAEHPLKKDYTYVESNFSGGRPFEMSIQIRDTSASIWDYEIVQQLDTLENYLTKVYGVGTIVSPLTPIKMANVSNHTGNFEYFRVPKDSAEFDKIVKTLNKFNDKEKFSYFLNSNQDWARISGKIGDVGSLVTKDLNRELYAFIDKNIDTQKLDIQLTGAPHLMEINNQLLARNVIQGLLIAFGIISILVGLLYRSFSIIIISLIPNILPLVIIGGIMGFTGIDMKLSTSLIFTIAFGIAVDDTIHFLSKFRIEMKKGYSKAVALKRTYISTGKAIIMTSLILSGGFLTLAMSDFSGTAYIGILICVTLVLALILDLTLLPVLILKFYPKRKLD